MFIFCYTLMDSAKKKSPTSGSCDARYSLTVVTADCLTLSWDVRAAVMYVTLWAELWGQYGATSLFWCQLLWGPCQELRVWELAEPQHCGCGSVFRLGLCIGRNLAIRYVSWYRGYDSIYCDILRYCKQGDILLFFKSNFRSGSAFAL